MAKADGEAIRVTSSGWLSMLLQMAVTRKWITSPTGEAFDPNTTMVEVIAKGSHTGGLEVIVYYKINNAMIGPTILHAIWTPEELAEILG